ncbi:unnamed protein product [Pleuronectes platessa]|uniref:Uncharacterized protein n=1 Tax=Pleuronectes platessa TaxID=8262 RepID=A0A9N7V292_PLEPL|nr:unnamed protein product [Pleuronectes platessa]
MGRGDRGRGKRTGRKQETRRDEADVWTGAGGMLRRRRCHASLASEPGRAGALHIEQPQPSTCYSAEEDEGQPLKHLTTAGPLGVVVSSFLRDSNIHLSADLWAEKLPDKVVHIGAAMCAVSKEEEENGALYVSHHQDCMTEERRKKARREKPWFVM